MYDYLITWLSLKVDRRGVTALEYGLIAALIAAFVAAARFRLAEHPGRFAHRQAALP